MPTNVTPEFKRAKAEYQRAREPADRLNWLKEMLRTLPKHKGTEHLQADLKTRIKELTAELASPKKKGAARTGPAQTVRPEGAAQIALVGPPNSGKSSLHARLTGSQAEVAAYPNATHAALPGMMPFEDIQFQLIDLPPISVDFMESWMPNALQPAHACLLVVDLAIPGCVENVAAIRERLDEKRIGLIPDWPGGLEHGIVGGARGGSRKKPEEDDELGDPFRRELPTLLVMTKADLNPHPEEIQILEELVGIDYPAISVSTKTGAGLDLIGRLLFSGLDVVRVYTKIPGHDADFDRPYTLFRGDTVYDVAHLVHRELADTLRFARVWGSARFDGQRVGRNHIVDDKDVIELHV